MTEATGTLAAADAAPLTGAVVVDASLWDDAGLTLQQIGDLLHVFRTDTQTDVITPVLANEITSLNIIGRDNAADVLTIDLSFGWSLAAVELNFDAGVGPDVDRLALINAANQENWTRDSVHYEPLFNGSGRIVGYGHIWPMSLAEETGIGFRLAYQHVELVKDAVVSTPRREYYGYVFNKRFIDFDGGDNLLTVDSWSADGVTEVSESRTGAIIQFALRPYRYNRQTSGDGLSLRTGPGNDHVVIVRTTETVSGGAASMSSLSNSYLSIASGDGDDLIRNLSAVKMFAFGEDGNDTLVGGSGNDTLNGWVGDDSLQGGENSDALRGNQGNDTLEGQAGDDHLMPGLGHDILDGGPGLDKLYYDENGDRGYDGLVRAAELILTSERLVDSGVDAALASIEVAVLPYLGYSVWFDSDYWSESDYEEEAPPTANDDLPMDGDQIWLSPSHHDVLLIGQGIATVGIEDRELAEFDTASSDSAFGELADSESEDGEGPTEETLEDGGDLAANGDTNSADVGAELELDAALSDELLASLAEPST